MVKVVGIDLAGLERRDTGFCVMDTATMEVFTKVLHTDDEIVEEVMKVKPIVVAIDAPLSIPKGRKSIDERNEHHFRQCDKELLEMGIKFFPITLGPMRMLTKRGIKLKERLKKLGFRVIEVYPGGAQDVLNIPRKSDVKGLRDGLEKLGIKRIKKDVTHDELDAITAAYVAKAYVEGNYTQLGDEEEGVIIMPKL
ncbi:MAG: DUF429 domain-containing protein [Candidatus Aenigmarchaeota archaeon]|nr:DUF429 domain-containing protein [Candidatus Aenigmarchaeota archaeon]